jgi:hypothetical protein
MVGAWLQEHAAGHRMRFAEVVNNQVCRAWNIDCDACGTTLSMVASLVKVKCHLKAAKHVNALSAAEDPDTRVVQHRLKNRTGDWLQEHAAGHRLRFTEVVGKQVRRAWNVECDACGMTLSSVKSISEFARHLKTVKHVNAISADEDPATRVVQWRNTNKVDAWLQAHAVGHRMRFTEVVGKRGARGWNVVCGTCCSALHHVRAVTTLKRHLQSAVHLGAKVSSAPAISVRKRPRS